MSDTERSELLHAYLSGHPVDFLAEKLERQEVTIAKALERATETMIDNIKNEQTEKQT